MAKATTTIPCTKLTLSDADEQREWLELLSQLTPDQKHTMRRLWMRLRNRTPRENQSGMLNQQGERAP